MSGKRNASVAVSLVATLLLGVGSVRAEVPESGNDKSGKKVETGVEGNPAPPSLNIHSTVFSELSLDPSSPERAETEVGPVLSENQGSTPPPTSSMRVPGRVSTAPLSAGEKFKIFASGAFMPPGPYVRAAFSGTFNELFDKNDGRESTKGDYFGDAATRATRSFGFGITAGFFEKFAYPVVFKQDPRYHVSRRGGPGARIRYAVSRVLITQSDRGSEQFNASYLVGGITAAAIANAWERPERRTVGKTVRRFGVHVGLTAFANIVREFVSGQ